jgi:hypothetical protein
MLRIYDTRTGQVQEIARARALRMRACAGDLRSALLSDLIRRVLERQRVRMIVCRGVHEADGALNLRPPEHDAPAGPDCPAVCLRFLGERVDIHVGPDHQGAEVAVTHWVSGGESTGVPFADVTRAGIDPLAVRLAYLERRYREPMELTWEAVRAADDTLRRWRGRVAEWSESASAPMAAGYVERVEAAFDDDLDTPAALRELAALERDASVAPGSALESFLHLDQVLALDLSVEIGKSRAK